MLKVHLNSGLYPGNSGGPLGIESVPSLGVAQVWLPSLQASTLGQLDDQFVSDEELTLEGAVLVPQAGQTDM